MSCPLAKCLKHTNRDVVARGLCASCYQLMSRWIRDGKLTDKQAVRRGLILPRRKGWPGTNNPRRVKPFPKT